MTARIVISTIPGEMRVAQLETLALWICGLSAVTSDRVLVTSIWAPWRVLPGMQAAFVDIGLAKAGFLYVADLAD